MVYLKMQSLANFVIARKAQRQKVEAQIFFFFEARKLGILIV